MPDGRIPFPHLNVEEPLGQVKDAVTHVVVLEILPCFLRVVVVIRLLNLGAEPRQLVRFDPVSTGAQFLKHSEQLRVVALCHRARGGIGLLYQVFHLVRRVEHPVGELQRGVVLETGKLRQFVAQCEDFAQHLVVRGPCALAVELGIAAAQVVAFGIGHNWHVIWRCRGERDHAVLAHFASVDVVLWQAGQFFRRDFDSAYILGDVLREIGGKVRQPGIDFLHPCALRVVQGNTGAAESVHRRFVEASVGRNGTGNVEFG